MTTHRVRTFTIVALMVGLSAAPYGQTRRRLTLVDLLNVPRLTDPQLSPDGRQILYELAAADWKADKRVSHVWRVGVDGSGTVQMTDGPGEQGARWSPDGQTIVYVGKRTGEEAQIYQMSNSGGEGRPLTHHASSVSRLSWSPDGRDLFFVAPDPKTPEELQREHLAHISRLLREGKAIAVGPFLDDTDLRGICIFDSDSVEEVRAICLTDPGVRAGAFRVDVHPWYGPRGITFVPPRPPGVEGGGSE